MKLLLTSSGITNDSIRQALTELLGTTISEASACDCWPYFSFNPPHERIIGSDIL